MAEPPTPLQHRKLSCGRLVYSISLSDACHSHRQEDMLLDKEGHSWTRNELHIGDLQWIRAPSHVTGDHMAIAKDAFHHSYMAQTGGPLYAGLQIYDGSIDWCGGDAPAKLVSTSRPLPGISLRPPWHEDAM